MGHHRDPEREPVYDRPEKLVAALEAGLRRLETDHVDVYFCHIWWDKPEETEAPPENLLFADLGLRSIPHPHRLLARRVISERQDRFFLSGEGMSEVLLREDLLYPLPDLFFVHAASMRIRHLVCKPSLVPAGDRSSGLGAHLKVGGGRIP